MGPGPSLSYYVHVYWGIFLSRNSGREFQNHRYVNVYHPIFTNVSFSLNVISCFQKEAIFVSKSSSHFGNCKTFLDFCWEKEDDTSFQANVNMEKSATVLNDIDNVHSYLNNPVSRTLSIYSQVNCLKIWHHIYVW